MTFRPTRMEVDLEAIAGNFRTIRGYAGSGCQVFGVVKADGYGMGMVPVAEALQKAGCQRFAVATPDEALDLRKAGIQDPVLVLGPSPAEAAEELILNNIEITLFNLANAKAFSEAAKGIGQDALAHIKIDTGMGRIGFLPDAFPQAVREIRSLPGLRLSGLFTHFATADERHREYTDAQFQRYGDVLGSLREEGVGVPLRHVCNSAAFVNFPEMHLDAVRPGLLVYGMWPSPYCRQPFHLQECFRVKSALMDVRTLPARWGVSYGIRYMTRGEDQIGVLPIGYHDGLPRSLSMKGEVLIRGRRAPLVGAICMDQTMVDVSHIEDVQAGDEVVFVGCQGEDAVSPEEFAGRLGTINYEVPSLFTPRVPRRYTS
ncbi:MAG: alanine racemase [Synergistales bacterium]|nr:alanine racemase [Synergistales bacterium]